MLTILVRVISQCFDLQTLHTADRREHRCRLPQLLSWIQWEGFLIFLCQSVLPVTDLVPDLALIIFEDRSVLVPHDWVIDHTEVSVGELDHLDGSIARDYGFVVLPDEVLWVFY